MLTRLKALVPNALAGFAAVVFLDSLRFKFTNSPETQVIFGKLDAWAASLGAGGLFAAAMVIWGSAIVLVALRRNELTGMASGLVETLVPTRHTPLAPASPVVARAT